METRPQVAEGVQRLKGVFLEIPGTRLTLLDAIKLSGLDQPVCKWSSTSSRTRAS